VLNRPYITATVRVLEEEQKEEFHGSEALFL